VTLTIVLACAAALLALAPVAVMIGRSPAATPLVYGVSVIVTAISLIAASAHLLSAAAPLGVTLPVGLPWLGAHLRIDALSAFFLGIDGHPPEQRSPGYDFDEAIHAKPDKRDASSNRSRCNGTNSFEAVPSDSEIFEPSSSFGNGAPIQDYLRHMTSRN